MRQHTGLDMAALLTHNSVDEAPLTPTKLGKELLMAGLQVLDEEAGRRPTEKGKPFCTVNPYKSPHSGHSGYRLLWYRSVLEELTAAA